LKKIFPETSFDIPSLPLALQYFISRRKTTCYECYECTLITVNWTRLQWRIDMRYHWYLNFLINLDKASFIAWMIYKEFTIWYALKKETNEKLYSKQGMLILNTMSCLLDLPMHWPPFKIWWMMFSASSWISLSCAIYIDILIYFKNIEEHKEHVNSVLQKLWNDGLYAELEKCVFY